MQSIALDRRHPAAAATVADDAATAAEAAPDTMAAPACIAGRQPIVCVLSLSPIADDPRVRRQAEAFYRAGWQVVAVGMPGARSAAPEWPILTRDNLPPPEPAPEPPLELSLELSPEPSPEPLALLPEPPPEPLALLLEPSVSPVAGNAVAEAASRGDRSPLAQLQSARRLLPWVWEEHGLASVPPLQRYRLALAWTKALGLRYSRLVLVGTAASGLRHSRRVLAWTAAPVLRHSRRIIARTATPALRHSRRVVAGTAASTLLSYRRVLASSIRRAAPTRDRARYALRLQATRVRPEVAQDIYWSFSSNILDIHACAGRVHADVWLANDWTALPLAARLARETGGIYGYDTHEFATEEYGHKLKWRFWNRPMIRALEHSFIGGAAVVSAVSAGIAERLDRMYRLPRPAMVIRNTPAFEEPRFRPTGETIGVLYHGILAPGRGLEASIDSVILWRPEFSLVLRGPGDAEFIAGLRRRIEMLGLADRVSVVPPVPMTDLVREAAAFDIGLFALPGNSRHNQFALPNKFFEYVMAGLALCVSDLPEMARLVQEYGLGVTIAAAEPQAIAAAVNRLDRAAIDAYKRRSVAAARELCWEREAGRLVTAYEAALAATVRG